MSAIGAFNFPTLSSFSSHPPDPASSGFGSSSQIINPIVNTYASTNPSTSNTMWSGILPAPSSVADSSFVGDFVPLNNATNTEVSAQLLPSHDTSGLQLSTDVEQDARENTPPSQSHAVASGSKRKADLDENISGPNPKKIRALPIGQEPSQTQVMIQEFRAGPALAHQTSNQHPQGGFNNARPGSACFPAEIPPEIAAIEVELKGANFFPIPSSGSSVSFPSCSHLFTTVILREDFSTMEKRFYPYLWFHGRAPYMLKAEDFGNVFSESHVGAIQEAMRRLGIVCGTLGLTASKQPVLFFQREEREMIRDAMKKMMGTNFNNARWQGAKEIPVQNHVVEHHEKQRNGPTRNTDPFILVSHETAKRRRNCSSPSVSVPDAPQAVSGPSMPYPSSAVFAETHTKESFPHPQNTNPAVVPKKRNRRRAPAKSGGDKSQNATTVTQQQSQLECQQPQREKRHGNKAQDTEPSQSQAGPSGSTFLEPQALEIQPVYSVPQQVSNNGGFLPENTQAFGFYNGEQSAPYALSNVDTSQTLASQPTGQIAFAAQGYPQYNGDIASQALEFGSADILGGGYRAPHDFGGHYQHSSAYTAPSSFPSASLLTGPTAAVSSANFHDFATEYDTRTASQALVSQPSDQVVNVDGDPNIPIYLQLGQAQGLLPEPSIPYESSYTQLQPASQMGFDANGCSNLPNFVSDQELLTSIPWYQNLAQEPFYLPSEGFAQVPDFSGFSAGGGFSESDGQAWNLTG